MLNFIVYEHSFLYFKFHSHKRSNAQFLAQRAAQFADDDASSKNIYLFRAIAPTGFGLGVAMRWNQLSKRLVYR